MSKREEDLLAKGVPEGRGLEAATPRIAECAMRGASEVLACFEGSARGSEPEAAAGGGLRVYAAPWKGYLLVACRKCQKKLKSNGEAANLKKALKRRAKEDGSGVRLRVLRVPCLKLCPKGGVTVGTQRQLGRGECLIVRTSGDLDALYRQCREEAGASA